LFDKMTTVQLV